MTAPTTRLYWAMGNVKAMPAHSDRGELYESTLSAYAAGLVAPGTEVTIGWQKRAGPVYNSISLALPNDLEVVADIVDAERAGYHAAMIGPHWDPGLYAAREAAGIPVAGGGEAAMMFAHTLGARFAVVTTSEGIVPFIERAIRLYGFDARAIARRPVRSFGLVFENLVAAIEGTGDRFFEDFSRVARECIDDGADAVLAGGQLFGPAFQRAGYLTVPNTGVPVVEVAACGLKVAESLAVLKRSIGLAKSEHPRAPFRSPGAAAIDGVLRQFGFR